MSTVSFDHIITYTSAASIDGYLQQYAALGFAPEEGTVRHEPGLRNGFVFIGPEYVEFCWVEDEALFEQARERDRRVRANPRPFGIGMVAGDVQVVHDDWTARGYVVPDVTTARPRDAGPDTPPVWSFQEIPDELLPGAWCFALTYHRRPQDQERAVKVPPNTVYAVSGVAFVTPEPEARAEGWRDLLAPGEGIKHSEGSASVRIGPHRATWMAPEAYRAAYAFDWEPHPLPQGELALLELLAADVEVARGMMEAGGRKTWAVSRGREEAFVIAPDPRDGLVFAIRQRPVEAWLRERAARTGERLKVTA